MTVLRRVPELWRGLDVTLRDLPLALLLVVGTFLPLLKGHETQIGDLPPRPFDALAYLAIALLCLPMAVRRRLPALCLALVSVGFLIASLRAYHMVAATALPLALVSAGAHLERHRKLAMLLLTTVYLGLVVALARLGSPEGHGFVTVYLLFAIGWRLGSWLRSTRIAEAERRRLVAEESRVAERTRIARELHDVVTHHVTAMVVQAEAARYVTATPDRLDSTLGAITDTGRHAISDLRRLLDVLDPDHDSGKRTPPIGRLSTLVEQTRLAGQPVEFSEQGSPEPSTGTADLVAYRVVQEALTNALEYAHGSRTSVQVRHGGSEINVRVSTDGSGTRAGFRSSGGRGLAGLAERVELLGGDFSAGRRTGGDFVVQARIPAGSTA